MNNYCKHLKKRKGKPFCKILNKEITLSECSAVNSAEHCREYKTKKEKNLVYGINWNKNGKVSNNHQIRKSPVYKGLSPVIGRKIKNKSNKLSKLERNRYSVFTDDLTTCYICGKPKEHLHEIFFGSNRLNSIKYGFVLPVCHECHRKCHSDSHIQEELHKRGQLYWEEVIGDREEFIGVFRRNYLG